MLVYREFSLTFYIIRATAQLSLKLNTSNLNNFSVRGYVLACLGVILGVIHTVCNTRGAGVQQ